MSDIKITYSEDDETIPVLPIDTASALAVATESRTSSSQAAAAAADSASLAATSAAAAATAIIPYYGPRSSDPTTRPSGAAMVDGDIYYSTVSHSLLIYSAGVWTSLLFNLPVSRGAALLALKANSTGSINWLSAVQAALPPSESDDTNLRFMDAFWPLGGAAWAFVNTTLTAALAGDGGFSPSQLAALQAQALTMRENT